MWAGSRRGRSEWSREVWRGGGGSRWCVPLFLTRGCDLFLWEGGCDLTWHLGLGFGNGDI